MPNTLGLYTIKHKEIYPIVLDKMSPLNVLLLYWKLFLCLNLLRAMLTLAEFLNRLLYDKIIVHTLNSSVNRHFNTFPALLQLALSCANNYILTSSQHWKFDESKE